MRQSHSPSSSATSPVSCLEASYKVKISAPATAELNPATRQVRSFSAPIACQSILPNYFSPPSLIILRSDLREDFNSSPQSKELHTAIMGHGEEDDKIELIVFIDSVTKSLERIKDFIVNAEYIKLNRYIITSLCGDDKVAKVLNTTDDKNNTSIYYAAKIIDDEFSITTSLKQCLGSASRISMAQRILTMGVLIYHGADGNIANHNGKSAFQYLSSAHKAAFDEAKAILAINGQNESKLFAHAFINSFEKAIPENSKAGRYSYRCF